MHHLVRQHPVIREARKLRLAPHMNHRVPAVSPAKCTPAAHTPPIRRDNPQQQMWNRKASVISRDRFRGPMHPGHQLFFGNAQVALLDNDINARIANQDGRGHFVSRVGTNANKNCEEHCQSGPSDLSRQ